MVFVEQFPCTNPALRLRQWAQGPDAIYRVFSSRGAILANVQKRVDKFSRTEKSGWTIPVNERAENWRFTRTGQ